MKRQTIFTGACALALTILPLSAETNAPAMADAPAKQSADAVVARVNGTSITRAQLDEALQERAEAMAQAGQAMPAAPQHEVETNVLDQLVEQQLVLEKSKTVKLDDLDTKVNDELAQMKKQFPHEKVFAEKLKEMKLTEDKLKARITEGLRMEALVDQDVRSKIQVSTNEVKAFYDSHPQYFLQPAQIRASHILVLVPKDADDKVKAEKKALVEKARERVMKGEEFAKVASEVSEDPSTKERGGDLGFFSKGLMVKPFEDVAFSLKSNEVSQVVTTQYGYHVIKLIDSKPASTIPLEQEQGRIEGFLVKQKMRDAMRTYIDGLKKDAKIELLLK